MILDAERWAGGTAHLTIVTGDYGHKVEFVGGRINPDLTATLLWRTVDDECQCVAFKYDLGHEVTLSM